MSNIFLFKKNKTIFLFIITFSRFLGEFLYKLKLSVNLCQQIEHGVLSLRSLEIVCSFTLTLMIIMFFLIDLAIIKIPLLVCFVCCLLVPFCYALNNDCYVGLYLMFPVDEIRIELADVSQL